MFSNYRFYRYSNHQEWKLLLGFGLLVLLLGMLILVFPEILVAFIASLFFIAGISIISLAWSLRKKSTSGQQTIKVRWFD